MIAIATHNVCDFKGTSSDRRQELAELKTQIDAREVIGEYVELKGTGETRSGKCPFHEDRKASFVVGHDGYRCMACDEKGDAIEFLQKHLSMSFQDAVADLADRVNMNMPAFFGQSDRHIPNMVQITAGDLHKTKPKPKRKPKSEPQLVSIPACPSGEWDKPSIIRIEPIEKTADGKGYGPDGLDFRKAKVGDNWVSVDRYFFYPYKGSESAAVVRLEYMQDGKLQKIFRQLQKIEGKWKFNGKGIWEGYREGQMITAIKKNFSERGGSYPADLIPTVLSTEGEKCAEAMHELGLPCLTHRGSASMKEKEESLSRLKKLHPHLIVVHLEDNDDVGARKGKELIKVGFKIGLPVISLPTARLVNAQLCEKGDVVDVLENMNQQEFINRLEKEIHKVVAERQAQDRARESSPKSQAPTSDRRGIEWNHNLIAKEIAEKYRGKMAWDVQIQQWRRYSSELEGIWEIEPKEFVRQIIRIELEPIAEMNRNPKSGKLPNVSNSVVSGVEALLKDDLAVRKWNEDNLKLIPFENGVFNLETRELTDHSPSHYLTWCLPYSYNPEAKCDKIRRWMLEMSHGNQTQVDLFRAYLYAIVTARSTWHSYMEMIGPGGAGKSTFINLAIALVGVRNTHTTKLQKLEGKFETACLKGKRLVCVTDADKYMGEVGMLKALTGGDFLPYERKNKDSSNGFFPICKVIVAANTPIQSADYTSGLERRRLIVEMTNQIEATEQRNLISFEQGLDGEFVPEIPGLLNWVLDLGEKEAEKIIKERLGSQTVAKAKNLLATNPFADWADTHIIHDPEAKTYVGGKNLNSGEYLYASYSDYCEMTNSKTVSSRRYTGLLEDLLLNQLKLEVSRHRDRKGSYFQGVKLRYQSSFNGAEKDIAPDIPLLISGKFNDSPPDNLPPDTPPPPPPPPPDSPPPDTTPPSGDTTGAKEQEPVRDNQEPVKELGPQQNLGLCDGSVTGHVTAGTLVSDGCDECDGLLNAFVETRVENLETLEEPSELIENEVQPAPDTSHPSQPIIGKGFGNRQPVTAPITDPSQSTESPVNGVVSEIDKHKQEIECSINGVVYANVLESYDGLCEKINQEIKRLDWSLQQEQASLLERYESSERACISDKDLADFAVFLGQLELEEREGKSDREHLNEVLDGELERIGWTRSMESEELQKKYGVEGGRLALTEEEVKDWRETLQKFSTASKVRIKGQTGNQEWTVVRKYYSKYWGNDRYDLLAKGNVDDKIISCHDYQVEIVEEYPL